MGGGGGSFLGTAAAAAAGVVGGSLLLGSIRAMMGGHRQSSAIRQGVGGSGSRGAISPAASLRAMPASTASARRQWPTTAVRAPACSIRRQTTTIDRDDMTWIRTISAATATAITPEASSRPRNKKRPLDQSGRFNFNG